MKAYFKIGGVLVTIALFALLFLAKYQHDRLMDSAYRIGIWYGQNCR